MANLWEMSIQELQAELTAGTCSAVEVAQACIARIHDVEDRVKSFVTVTEDVA